MTEDPGEIPLRERLKSARGVAGSPLRHVRLGPGLEEQLRAERRRTGAPAAEIIRRALAAYLGRPDQ